MDERVRSAVVADIVNILDRDPSASTRAIAKELGMPESSVRPVVKQARADSKAKGEITPLDLDLIELDPRTQPRVSVPEATIAGYAEDMLAYAADPPPPEDAFPPIVIFYDGRTHWLADGWNRVAAARRAGLVEIMARVRPGSLDDAILHSCQANAHHGLPRSNADKRRAVTTYLGYPGHAEQSDNVIARACRVSVPLVGEVRRELEERETIPVVTERVSANGVVRDSTKGRRPKAAETDDDEATADGEEAAHPSSNGEPQSDPDFLETIPARKGLPPLCKEVFDRDVIAYRRARPHIDALRRLGLTGGRKFGELQGEFQVELSAFLRLPEPHFWLICGTEGCNAGYREDGKPCRSCRGRGYVIR